MDRQKVTKPQEGLHLEGNSSLPSGAPKSASLLPLVAAIAAIFHAPVTVFRTDIKRRDPDSEAW